MALAIGLLTVHDGTDRRVKSQQKTGDLLVYGANGANPAIFSGGLDARITRGNDAKNVHGTALSALDAQLSGGGNAVLNARIERAYERKPSGQSAPRNQRQCEDTYSKTPKHTVPPRSGLRR